MTARISCLPLLVALVAQDGSQSGRPATPSHATLFTGLMPPRHLPLAVRSSTWKLEWDDRVDGVLQIDSKSCQVALSFERDKVSGSFLGCVLGEARDAKWSGEVFGSDSDRLILLRQVEGTYVCGYQLQTTKEGWMFGVWHDNKGRSGDARFRHVEWQ